MGYYEHGELKKKEVVDISIAEGEQRNDDIFKNADGEYFENSKN